MLPPQQGAQRSPLPGPAASTHGCSSQPRLHSTPSAPPHPFQSQLATGKRQSLRVLREPCWGRTAAALHVASVQVSCSAIPACCKQTDLRGNIYLIALGNLADNFSCCRVDSWEGFLTDCIVPLVIYENLEGRQQSRVTSRSQTEGNR